MKNSLLKSFGILFTSFLVLSFMGCKDQRNENHNAGETYPITGDTESTGGEYYREDASYRSDGTSTSQSSQSYDNLQSGNQQGNQQSDNQMGNDQMTDDQMDEQRGTERTSTNDR